MWEVTVTELSAALAAFFTALAALVRLYVRNKELTSEVKSMKPELIRLREESMRPPADVKVNVPKQPEILVPSRKLQFYDPDPIKPSVLGGESGVIEPGTVRIFRAHFESTMMKPDRIVFSCSSLDRLTVTALRCGALDLLDNQGELPLAELSRLALDFPALKEGQMYRVDVKNHGEKPEFFSWALIGKGVRR